MTVSHSNPRVASGSYEGSKFPEKSAKSEKPCSGKRSSRWGVGVGGRCPSSRRPSRSSRDAATPPVLARRLAAHAARPSGRGAGSIRPGLYLRNRYYPARPLLGTFNFLFFTDFFRFFGLSWETSPQTDSTPEASKRSGSGRIEFSSKSTAFLMW